MLLSFRSWILPHKNPVRRMSTTPTPKKVTQLSSQPHTMVPVVVKARPIPKVYDKKTFDKKDPSWAQLLQENHTRRQHDTKNFVGRVLTRVTGTLRKRKRQHRFDLAALLHVLERHSLRHFAGQLKSKNNFFAEDTTIAQISALVVLVYRNGRRMQRRPAKPGEVVDKSFFQITGRVNNVSYVLGVKGSKVVQFYPKKDSVGVPGPTKELVARLRAGRKAIPASAPEEE